MGEEESPIPVKQISTNNESFTSPPLPVPLPVPVAVAVPRPKLDVLSGPFTKSLPKMSVEQEATESAAWNTQNLGLRCGADAVAAAAAAVLVAPVITSIDKGIIENASGRTSLGESLRKSAEQMVRRPVSFFGSKPFGLIFVS